MSMTSLPTKIRTWREHEQVSGQPRTPQTTPVETGRSQWCLRSTSSFRPPKAIRLAPRADASAPVSFEPAVPRIPPWHRRIDRPAAAIDHTAAGPRRPENSRGRHGTPRIPHRCGRPRPVHAHTADAPPLTENQASAAANRRASQAPRPRDALPRVSADRGETIKATTTACDIFRRRASPTAEALPARVRWRQAPPSTNRRTAP